MPEFTTHYLFGKSILDDFSQDVVSVIKNNILAFNWGLQGPDLLFYSKVIRDSGRMARAGVSFHHLDPEEIFSAMLKYILTYKNMPGYGSLCSYLYGFVCHYALDSTAHPYVYSLITKLDGQSSTKRHIQVESEIGSLMYRRLTGMPVSSFKIYEHYSKRGEFVTPISKLYVYLVKNLLDKTVLCNEVKSGFSFCLFTNYFTYFLARNELNCKTKTILLKGAKALVKKLGIVNCFIKSDSVSHDTLNLMHNEWYNLNDPEKIFTYSFPELFDIAKEEAVELTQKCNEMLKNNEITIFNLSKSFDNGEPHKESKKSSEKIPKINFKSAS